MALEDHLLLRLMLDGKIQVKVSAIQVQVDGAAVRVDTLEGLAGKTEGAGSINISGTWAVPKGGLEFNFLKAIAEGTYHDATIPLGAETLSVRGWFQDGSIGRSVNSSTEAQANFIAEIKAPE
jgi:hypothetical protein